jgi:hypothetical protein
MSIKIIKKQGWGITQVIEFLTTKHKTLGSVPNMTKKGPGNDL